MIFMMLKKNLVILVNNITGLFPVKIRTDIHAVFCIPN
jgi:hypothetical protein